MEWKSKRIFNGKLIYEGEYLKGKKNGKAKEYSNSALLFEGEYWNGERNGKEKNTLTKMVN